MELLSGENFKTTLASHEVVVVDFFATWCGPCRMIAPFLEEISQEIQEVKIFKVDIDQAPDIASEYGIMSVPTLILFKNGQKVSSCVGGASKTRLLDWIKSHL